MEFFFLYMNSLWASTFSFSSLSNILEIIGRIDGRNFFFLNMKVVPASVFLAIGHQLTQTVYLN